MKEELRAQYVKSLSARIDTIDTLEIKFRDGNEIADQNIRLLAHELHGSGSTFGFHAITKASAALETAKEQELIYRMMLLKKVLQKIITGYTVAFPDQVAASKARPVYEKQADEKLVLIIEDNAEIVALIRHCLDQQKGKVTTVVAEDALHAEDELLKGNYDLVILDLVLPDKDGRELLRAIKIDFQLPYPVIVLSGITKDLVRVDCMSLGANRYIPKPFDADFLSQEIGKLLGDKEDAALSLVPITEEEGEKESKPESAEDTAAAAQDEMALSVVPQSALEIMPESALDFGPEAETEIAFDQELELALESELEVALEPELEIAPDSELENSLKAELDVSPEPKPRATTVAQLPLEGNTILVVDDDVHLGELICHLMEKQGAIVKYVSKGSGALDALKTSRCSLVVLDLTMPDMDGFETLEKIRDTPRLKGLPVIMVTAMGSEENIVRGYELGANDYILKPFSEEQLVNRIRSLLVMAA